MKTVVATVFGALCLMAFVGCDNATQSEIEAVDYIPVFERSSAATQMVGSQAMTAPEMAEGEFLRSILTPTVTGFRRASGQRIGTTVHGNYLGRQVSATVSRSGPSVIYDGSIADSGGTFRVSLGPNSIDYQQRVIVDAQNVIPDDDDDDNGDPPDQIYLIDISMSSAEMNRHGWIRGTVYVNLALGPYPDGLGDHRVYLMRYVFNLIASEELFAVDLINKHFYNIVNEDQNGHLEPSVAEIAGFDSADQITYDNAQPVINHISDLEMADPDPGTHRDYFDWYAIVFENGEFAFYDAETLGGAAAVADVWERFTAQW